MPESITNQDNPSCLVLKGSLQLSVAIGVLTLTGRNPQALEMLETLLTLHQHTTEPGAKNDLEITIGDDPGLQLKKDIIASALLAARDKRLSQLAHNNVRGLLEALGVAE